MRGGRILCLRARMPVGCAVWFSLSRFVESHTGTLIPATGGDKIRVYMLAVDALSLYRKLCVSYTGQVFTRITRQSQAGNSKSELSTEQNTKTGSIPAR